MREQLMERNLKIKALRDEGHKLAEIGQMFDITACRVREICRAFDRYDDVKERVGPVMAKLPNGIRNALLRAQIKNDYDLFKSIEDKSIYEIRNIGEGRRKVIFETIKEVVDGEQ